MLVQEKSVVRLPRQQTHTAKERVSDVESVVRGKRRSRNPVDAIKPRCGEFAPIRSAESNGSKLLLKEHSDDI